MRLYTDIIKTCTFLYVIEVIVKVLQESIHFMSSIPKYKGVFCAIVIVLPADFAD